MVVNGFYFKVIVILVAWLTVLHGFTIKLKEDKPISRVTLSDVPQLIRRQKYNLHDPTVHHYARHGLCRTFKGKQYFYKVIKRKLCGIRHSFTERFVIDLCRHRNKMLDTWVAELFDIDGNGYISHFEKKFFVEDD